MQHKTSYIIFFATAICIVCAIVVSSSAVALKERQDANALLDKQQNVLLAAGLAEPGEKPPAEVVAERFKSIQAVVVDLQSGDLAEDVDAQTFDQQKMKKDPQHSRMAPANSAGISRLPNRALVYQKFDTDGKLELLILPIEGKGLWSTLYGFLAIDSDLNTIRGITFYEHKETPGLGGEVDNPKWKALWPGRKAYGEDGTPQIKVIKGRAGNPESDPYRVDGLSGATLTARGVSHLVRFWLGENGFGPYIEKLRRQETNPQDDAQDKEAV